jgi:hypothetical protein
MLQAWRQQPFGARYRTALAVVVRLLSLAFGVAGVAFFAFEPSARTALLVLGLWAITVPLAALGYVRKLDRLARRAPPISPARRDPKTATDIRRAKL